MMAYVNPVQALLWTYKIYWNIQNITCLHFGDMILQKSWKTLQKKYKQQQQQVYLYLLE